MTILNFEKMIKYITEYKKVYHCYVNMGFNWFKSDNKQYITLNYKKD